MIETSMTSCADFPQFRDDTFDYPLVCLIVPG
jgi:hypothetical protein